MTPELYSMLRKWLESGDDAQKNHAAHRLSLPDATDFKPDPLEYPTLFQQAMNLAVAVGAVVAGAILGEPISVDQEEQDRRLAICHACEFWDAAAGAARSAAALGPGRRGWPRRSVRSTSGESRPRVRILGRGSMSGKGFQTITQSRALTTCPSGGRIPPRYRSDDMSDPIVPSGVAECFMTGRHVLPGLG